MKSNKLTLLMFVVLLFSVNINAQSNKTGNWCGTDKYMEQKHNQNPALLLQQEMMEQYILDNKETFKSNINNKQAINFVIPVVWHVVTYNGQGNVTKADIDDQMLTLNEDFQRLNADASNTRIQFAP
ncbi:MAG: hypothetical protein JKX68_01755, partial [Flavobacteriales bacterium]|nr:hypothetical protein [Flavobacteriales bacterium]